ncbi:hypothetical protein RFI_12009 [Reticulomyxa filosa]|uniref:Kelch motif family protein n=1 Tax=Reticulomyxa filosa TaxID=46433 RepID=X6NGL4_RETFI|nr:hypothetical protein RFI_12009 [Reticulomyxa filosa]|eukprot:ETO25136.1 hypothetical protein RFI_12009 [Reticulomyxa filosa]
MDEQKQLMDLDARLSPAFKKLRDIPVCMEGLQCMRYKNELIICGGTNNSNCYSYHLRKREYKFICAYPKGTKLKEHVVIKFGDTSSGRITLLSFGGYYKHTLQMDYQSVWEKPKEHLNEWKNCHYEIGEADDNLFQARALIGGNNNNLLFVIYNPGYILALDIENSFKCVAKRRLPIDGICGGSCFVKCKDKMIFLNYYHNVAITYNDSNHQIEFRTFSVDHDVRHYCSFSYVYINEVIVIFGGFASGEHHSEKIFVYSVKRNKWKTSSEILPIGLFNSSAVLHDIHRCAHILGGLGNIGATNLHFKVNLFSIIGITGKDIQSIVQNWQRRIKLKHIGWIDEFNDIIADFLW